MFTPMQIDTDLLICAYRDCFSGFCFVSIFKKNSFSTIPMKHTSCLMYMDVWWRHLITHGCNCWCIDIPFFLVINRLFGQSYLCQTSKCLARVGGVTFTNISQICSLAVLIRPITAHCYLYWILIAYLFWYQCIYSSLFSCLKRIYFKLEICSVNLIDISFYLSVQ